MADSDSSIIKRLTEYVHIKIEQLKLKVIGSVSRLLANILAFSAIAVLVVFFVFFLSLSVGAFLNARLASPFSGYLIVAGFYFLVIVILLLLTRTHKVRNWFENLFIRIIDNEDESEA